MLALRGEIFSETGNQACLQSELMMINRVHETYKTQKGKKKSPECEKEGHAELLNNRCFEIEEQCELPRWSKLKKIPACTASTTGRSGACGQAGRPRCTVSTICAAPDAASQQLRVSKSFTQ